MKGTNIFYDNKTPHGSSNSNISQGRNCLSYLPEWNDNTNFKGMLQEYLIAIHKPMPNYNSIRAGGPDHVPKWNCVLFIGDSKIEITDAPNKKTAEQKCAYVAYTTYLMFEHQLRSDEHRKVMERLVGIETNPGPYTYGTNERHVRHDTVEVFTPFDLNILSTLNEADKEIVEKRMSLGRHLKNKIIKFAEDEGLATRAQIQIWKDTNLISLIALKSYIRKKLQTIESNPGPTTVDQSTVNTAQLAVTLPGQIATVTVTGNSADDRVFGDIFIIGTFSLKTSATLTNSVALSVQLSDGVVFVDHISITGYQNYKSPTVLPTELYRYRRNVDTVDIKVDLNIVIKNVLQSAGFSVFVCLIAAAANLTNVVARFDGSAQCNGQVAPFLNPNIAISNVPLSVAASGFFPVSIINTPNVNITNTPDVNVPNPVAVFYNDVSLPIPVSLSAPIDITGPIEVQGLALPDFPVWTTNVRPVAPASELESFSALDAKAKVHNREMHAINGNQINDESNVFDLGITPYDDPKSTGFSTAYLDEIGEYRPVQVSYTLKNDDEREYANDVIQTLLASVIDTEQSLAVKSMFYNYEPALCNNKFYVLSLLEDEDYSDLEQSVKKTNDILDIVKDASSAGRAIQRSLDIKKKGIKIADVSKEKKKDNGKLPVVSQTVQPSGKAEPMMQDDTAKVEHKGRQIPFVCLRIGKKLQTPSDYLAWILQQKNAPSSRLIYLIFKYTASPELTTAMASTLEGSYVLNYMNNQGSKPSNLHRLVTWSMIGHTLTVINRASYEYYMTERYQMKIEQIEDIVIGEDRANKQLIHGLNYRSTSNEIGARLTTVEKNPGPSVSWIISNHNKEMHILNGNIDHWPENMEEVEQLPELFEVSKESKSKLSNFLNTEKLAAQVAGITGPIGVAQSGAIYQMSYNGQQIGFNNTVGGLGVDFPEAWMLPRTVRGDVAAPLINSTNRTMYSIIGLVRYLNMAKVERSSLYDNIYLKTVSGANIRDNQNTEFGFKTEDTQNIMRLKNDTGDDFTVLFLKLALYRRAFSLIAGTGNNLPLGMQPNKFDPRTRLANPVVVSLGYNDSPVFGENCGGNTPVAPFLAAAQPAPRFALHVSLATVPPGRRSSVIALRPQILLTQEVIVNANTNGSVNLLLLLLMFTVFPVGFHTFRVNTLDTISTNLQAQIFLLFSELLAIPGMTTIDILLPTTTAKPAPTDQASANSYAIIQPFTGPTLAVGLAANIQLNVNYIGAPALIDYSIIDFAYTWFAMPASPIDENVIWRFMYQISDVLGRAGDLLHAEHIASTYSVVYPVMQVSQINNGFIQPVNDPDEFLCSTIIGTLKNTSTVNYPFAVTNSPDMILSDPNPSIFTQVMMGTHKITRDLLTLDDSVEWGSGPYLMQDSIYCARMYALTMKTVYRKWGITIRTWNNIFNQTNLLYLRKILYGHFLFVKAGSSEMRVSNLSSWMLSMFRQFVGAEPYCDLQGNCLLGKFNVPSLGWLAPIDVTANRYNDVVPCIFNDLWYALHVEKMTLAFAPFLNPLQRMRGLPFKASREASDLKNRYTMLTNNGGVVSVTITADRSILNIGLKGLPRMKDVELWNSRLSWYTQAPVIGSFIASSNGVLYAGQVPATGRIIYQKFLGLQDFTLQNYLVSAAEVVVSATNWMPSTDDTGLILTTQVTGVSAPAMTQMMQGRAFAAINTWAFQGKMPLPNNTLQTMDELPDAGVFFDSDPSAKSKEKVEEVTLALKGTSPDPAMGQPVSGAT